MTAARSTCGQHVAVEHHHRFAQRLAGVADRAGRAERRGLDDVADADAGVAAVAEDLLDPARLVVEAEDHLVDLRHLLQQIELVVEERPVEDRHDRLRRVNRQRAQPRAFAPGEQDRLHAQPPMLSCDYTALMNLPNSLTVTRIFLVPLLVVVLLTKFEGRLSSACQGVRRRGDLRPGVAHRLARRLPGAAPQAGHPARPGDRSAGRQAADLGRAHLAVQLDLAPAWMVAVIIGREFAVTGLRSLAYSRGVVIPASPLGKIKMVAQVVAILALILGRTASCSRVLLVIGQAALWVVVVAALVSAADYFRRFNLVLNPRVADIPGRARAPRRSQGRIGRVTS